MAPSAVTAGSFTTVIFSDNIGLPSFFCSEAYFFQRLSKIPMEPPQRKVYQYFNAPWSHKVFGCLRADSISLWFFLKVKKKVLVIDIQ